MVKDEDTLDVDQYSITPRERTLSHSRNKKSPVAPKHGLIFSDRSSLRLLKAKSCCLTKLTPAFTHDCQPD